VSDSLLAALDRNAHVIAVELRPPRARLGRSAGMDAWIDTYHAVRTLARRGVYVFLTDSAVGAEEEDNLRHLVANVGGDAPRSQVVPFLTAKHTLDYCLGYADRAVEHGFRSLVVLGGDTSVGAPRCVPHAWQLRQALRARQPGLALGGWVNPHRNAAEQLGYLRAPEYTAEYALSQVVSHHDLASVAPMIDAAREGAGLPILWGAFYYRSANPATLRALRQFLPVPEDALTAEFRDGASSVDVCARTVRGLLERGVRHVYISNLPLAGAHTTLQEILKKAGI
jgi:5,10-methylenetetrahydrofolate reductase